jgi:hypothetical protein
LVMFISLPSLSSVGSSVVRSLLMYLIESYIHLLLHRLIN